MEETRILLGFKIMPFVSAALSFALLYRLNRGGRTQLLVLRTWHELSGLLREKERGSSWYQRKNRWLMKNGASFHYGSWVLPDRYTALKVMLGAAGFLAVSALSVESAVMICAVLYFLPDGLLLYCNGKDNERMLPELKLVYHALEIQIRAGVYVTDALAECYGSVREKRLRSALLDLAGDIVMKADIFDALERFQEKFDNRYVDSLCITILQALESGQALELLGDIGEQIKDVEETVLERKKAGLDRSITFYQLGVLAVVLGLALYACVTYMFGAAAGL